MKLERIHIEHYGAWRDLDLPVDSEGVSVYYGPNEAGKSTLMRFIRGVLYGFRKDDPGRPAGNSGQPWGGTLQVDQSGESWLVRRTGQDGTRGLVTARPAEFEDGATVNDARSLLPAMTADINESIYRNIFAIGLEELQEIASLESHEVAEHVYSLSLGLDGQELLNLIDQAREERSRLLDPETGTGEIAELHSELDSLDSDLEACSGLRRQHDELCSQQAEWEDSIVEMKQRQQGLESQLHGHEYMERVHEPWLRLRNYERELAKLPALSDFPRQGLADLETIETELAALRGRRSALREESRQLKAKIAEIDVDAHFRRYAPALQSFVDQKEWIAELKHCAEDADGQAEALREQLDEGLELLGNDWSIERLRRIDTSHLASSCLSQRASEFRQLNRRGRRLRAKYKRISKRFHRRQEELQKLQTRLGGISIEEAVERTREELAQLEDLSRLRIRETELEQRRVGISNQLDRVQVKSELPEWVRAIFIALGLLGVFLAYFGFRTGLSVSGVAGFGYVLCGASCGGMALALKRHFEGIMSATERDLRSELRELELRLAETRDAVARVTPIIDALVDRDDQEQHRTRIGSSANFLAQSLTSQQSDETLEDFGHTEKRPVADSDSLVATMWDETTDQIITRIPESTSDPSTSDTTPTQPPSTLRPRGTDSGGESARAKNPFSGKSQRFSEADLLRRALQRLGRLEQLAESENWVAERRHALIEMRTRLRDTQRDFGLARQNWTSHLAEQGLDETVDVDEALEQRDLVARTALILQRLTDLEADTQLARRLFERFRKRVEEFGHRLQQFDVDYSDPIPVLEQWHGLLVKFAEVRRVKRRLNREIRIRKREFAKARGRLRELESQQAAIFVRGGAASRDEFEDRAQLLERRFELEELAESARQELETVASTETALAIVESDLEQYDEEQNREAIVMIRRELDDLSLDLEDAFEKLGRVKQEIDRLEQDQTGAELRFEREQILARITSVMEDWFALEWSVQTLDELRLDFEQNHQPPILARASEYLKHLSGERYNNIWTPLGRRTLCVDDVDGKTLTAEQLSGGTREQLFLAIRFALIEQFSAEGVELPVVLDDVLVNFDRNRTEAAIDNLLQKIAQDQQVLYFTCHEHLAELFRRRGVSTVTLPTRRGLGDGKLAG